MQSRTEAWYALYTKPRHEFKVYSRLQSKKFLTFLPTSEELRQWWDRKKRIMSPLFPGYIFIKSSMGKKEYFEVLNTHGIVKVVGNEWPNLSKIPDHQIESLMIAVDNRLPLNVLSNFQKGDIVRITSGALKGIQGVLVNKNTKKVSIIISVDCLNKSIEINLENNNITLKKIE